MSLEDRSVPAVILGPKWNGIPYNGSPVPYTFPDVSVAAGVDRVVESANDEVRLYDKSGSGVALDTVTMQAFFGSATPSFNSIIVFDDNSNRFVAMCLEQRTAPRSSMLHIRVSNTATPTSLGAAEWSDGDDIDVMQGATPASQIYAYWARMGYNNEVVTIAFDYHLFATDAYSRTQVYYFDKTTLLDGVFGAAFAPTNFGNTNRSINPAQMHAAPVGAPQYFVGEAPLPTQIRVTTVAAPLGGGLGTATDLLYPPAYIPGPLPQIPNTTGFLDAGDTRIMSCAWRGDVLMATHMEPIGGEVKSRWFTFFTGGAAPTASVGGYINPGPGIHAFMPAGDIAANFDFGFTYLTSSFNQPIYMYVTGRRLVDAIGTLQPPRFVNAGALPLDDQSSPNPPLYPGGDRVGRYAGICVDPQMPNCFWAANEVTTPTLPNNWITTIQNFCLGIDTGPGGTPPGGGSGGGRTRAPAKPIRVYNSLRLTSVSPNGDLTGVLTLINVGASAPGPFTITFTFPDSSVILVKAGSTQTANVASYVQNGPLLPYSPIRIPVAFRNPLKHPLGTFFIGVATL